MTVEAGYYCKTAENLPLLGPVPEAATPGLFVCGALTGYGIMNRCVSKVGRVGWVRGETRAKLA